MLRLPVGRRVRLCYNAHMRPRTLASLFYFTYFAAMGTFFPYLNLYYQQAGMSTQQIGVLAAIPPLTVLIATPAWGAVADALGLHRVLLPLTLFLTALPALALTRADAFIWLALAALAYALFNAPVIPLADNASLELLGDQRDDYGRLRVWGAVSYGITAVAAGLLADRLGIAAAFVAFAALMVVTGLVSMRLPAPPRLTRGSYRGAMRQLAANPRWLAFLAAVFLAGMCISVFHNYLVVYMNQLGGSAALYGLAIAVASLSELPIFAYGRRLLSWLKPQGLLMAAFVALALRGVLLSLVHDPRWAVAVQLLHGPSFSAMWMAAVVFSGELAPRGLGASAQAVLNAAQFGFAAAAGALVGAALYASVGPARTFQAAALLALMGLALFALSEGRRGRV
jgi:MFS transporter, PPP family, 3-phenylpropionic acid transporter